ncbi:MAG: hypothetical protein SCARUB_03425 [Candidatus Scalindua rubra]|uniref:Uncharacterized protein n=1 Tax=Candidatus Scalindua rubra TaxID=1872076 RepID=A0A1E3X756_9BACT|nr:MAG: hypothetical protein SCARUB_03425 [Candidatus Scalindua rubra]
MGIKEYFDRDIITECSIPITKKSETLIDNILNKYYYGSFSLSDMLKYVLITHSNYVKSKK